MLIGASPMPSTETSTNCPGWWAMVKPLGSSRWNHFSTSVNCSTATMRAGVGM